MHETTIYLPWRKLANHYTIDVVKIINGNWHEYLKTRLEVQWAEPVSLIFHSALRKLNTEPSIGVSYQILVHLATQFQRRRLFSNRTTRNKNCLWWPCLLTNRDELNNLYRGPSKDASYQISFHFPQSGFRGEDFLEIHQSETRIACGGRVC